MDAIELVMKIWGIDDADRDELEEVLKNTTPKHLGLSLAYLGASSVSDHIEKKEEWMDTYLPELKFV